MLVTFNNEAVGPVIEIGIAPANPTAVLTAPPPNTVWIKAIADTGCSMTSIGTLAAQRAALPILGQGNVLTAAVASTANLFFGDIWIKGRFTGGSDFTWPFRNRVMMELLMCGANHEALLGMDIFREGMLIVNGPDSKTTFAW